MAIKCYLVLACLVLSVINANGNSRKPVTVLTDKITILYVNKNIVQALKTDVHEAGTANSNIDASVKFKETLPTDELVKIRLMKETNGKYRQMGNTVEHMLCEFVINDKLFYPSLRKSGNWPGRCPVNKGTVYYLKRYKVLTNEMPPLMPLGKWKIEFEIKNITTRVINGEWYGRIIQ